MTNEAGLARKIELLESRIYDLEQMELSSIGEKVMNLGLVRSYVLSLMGLRGFWPFGAIHKHGTLASGFTVPDASGSGLPLYAPIGGEPIVYHNETRGWMPYFDFNGTDEYLYSPSHINHHVSGTEPWIEAANKGFTMGCWVFPDVALGAASSFGIMGKYGGTTTSRSYYLLITEDSGPDNLRCLIQNSGGSTNFASSLALTVNEWNFVVMRFWPGVELKLWLNDDSESLFTGIRADCQEVTSNFAVGARGDGADFLNGKIAMPFLIGALLESAIIEEIFNISKVVIGL